MINNLSKFLTRLSKMVAPIRDLAKDKVPLNSDPEHQSALTQMKKEIASDPILFYYDPKKQTVLQTDARIKGLDACFLKKKNQFTLLEKP